MYIKHYKVIVWLNRLIGLCTVNKAQDNISKATVHPKNHEKHYILSFSVTFESTVGTSPGIVDKILVTSLLIVKN